MCTPGTEHTGRWTKLEHETFLKALRKYGKEWKKVAAMVKTRTVVQTRTHAQKYFQKLQKLQSSGEEGAVSLGSMLECDQATLVLPRATPLTFAHMPHIASRRRPLAVSVGRRV